MEEIVKSLKEIAEIEETYQAAYELVGVIEADLTVEYSHRSTIPKKFYRDKVTGNLWEDLGQVVDAILSDRLVINQEVKEDDAPISNSWGEFVSGAMEQAVYGIAKRSLTFSKGDYP